MSDLTERLFLFFFLFLKTYPVSECSFALAARPERVRLRSWQVLFSFHWVLRWNGAADSEENTLRCRS